VRTLVSKESPLSAKCQYFKVTILV